MHYLTFGLPQVNGGAGQEPLPVPQDQPGGAGGGTMAEKVQRLRQQVSLSEQVKVLFLCVQCNWNKYDMQINDQLSR